MIEFICGLFIGSFLAVGFMAVLNVAKDKDEKGDRNEQVDIDGEINKRA